MSRVILRAIHGTRAEVVRVYAYDPARDTVLCLFHGGGADSREWWLDMVSSLNLEAIRDDLQGTLADVVAELRKRAEHMLEGGETS